MDNNKRILMRLQKEIYHAIYTACMLNFNSLIENYVKCVEPIDSCSAMSLLCIEFISSLLS